MIDAVDANGNGTFDYHELEDLVAEYGMDADEANRIWDLCDADDNDSITAEELRDCLNAMY